MAFGPGKYDDLCTEARTQAEGSAAILIVFEGKHGSGFSVQAPLPLVMKIPDLLEALARDIRNTQSKGKL